MEEREQKRGGARCAIGCGVLLILVPVLYVLSLGPAVWIGDHYELTRDVITAVYYPLFLLAKRFEPIKQMLDWYVGLWR